MKKIITTFSENNSWYWIISKCSVNSLPNLHPELSEKIILRYKKSSEN